MGNIQQNRGFSGVNVVRFQQTEYSVNDLTHRRHGRFYDYVLTDDRGNQLGMRTTVGPGQTLGQEWSYIVTKNNKKLGVFPASDFEIVR